MKKTLKKLKRDVGKIILKDSGTRRGFGTGAVRDAATGKGRFDLLPLFGLLAGALQMERGMECCAGWPLILVAVFISDPSYGPRDIDREVD